MLKMVVWLLYIITTGTVPKETKVYILTSFDKNI